MRTPNIEEYKLLYNQLSDKWSIYYDKFLQNDLLEYCVKWVIEPLGLFSDKSGVTNNNMCEMYNHVIKKIIDRDNLPVDLMILTAYKLQVASYVEMRRGLAGVGLYTLKNCYRSMALNRYTQYDC